HVDQAAAPGAGDSARHREHAVDFVDATGHEDAADLHFLGKTQHVRLNTEFLKCPPSAGEPNPGLHLVENQQRLALIGNAPQSRQELGAEMIVSAFTLNGFDQDGGDLVSALVERALHRGERRALALDRVGEVTRKWERRPGGRYARPIDLRKWSVFVGSVLVTLRV